MKLTKNLKEWWPLYAIMAALVLVVAIAIPLAIRDQKRWEAWCVDQGGHVTDHTSSTVVTTVTGNGKVGTGVGIDITYYCLSADGRILDVQ